MNNSVFTFMLLTFLAGTGILFITQDKNKKPVDSEESNFRIEETSETIVDSIKIEPGAYEDKMVNTESVGDYQDNIDINDSTKNESIDIDFETSTLDINESIENKVLSTEKTEPFIKYEPENYDCIYEEEIYENSDAVNEKEINVQFSDNEKLDNTEIEGIGESSIELTDDKAVDKDAVLVSFLSSDDKIEIDIPERSWPDSNRIRQELTPEIAENHPVGNFVPRKVINKAWGVGERLTFSIDYGFVNAGTATMSVIGIEETNGGFCYQIETTAKSNDFISAFHEVSDSVHSFIDVEGIFSRRIEKKLREGRYKADRYVDFYPDRLIALSTREKLSITDIPLYTQDILSSLYILRTFDLEVGKDETITAYADGKVYPLRVIVHKIENIKVPAGKFNCIKIEPVLESEGIFRQKGRIIIWLTNDERKLPVKMDSKVLIGSIGSNLVKYSFEELE